MYYYEKETIITFQEVPNELALCLNIAECPHKCEGCHSPHLQGKENADYLTTLNLKALLYQEKDYTKVRNQPDDKKYTHCSAVCFMGDGGAKNKDALINFLSWIKHTMKLKTCLYTGNVVIDRDILELLDYVKIGKYEKENGSLNKQTTNQRFYSVNNGKLNKDLTQLF